MSGRTSVIIPAYNAEPYLSEALASVRSQTARVKEVLITDDGSSIPVQIPENWDGPPVRVIRTPNRGLAAARNTALALATGEFVAFLDADDLWKPQKIEAQEAALDANLMAVACFTQCIQSPGFFGFGPYPPADVSDDELTLVLWYHAIFPPSSLLVRRKTVEIIGPFREGMLNGEDVEWWFRLLRVGRLIQVPQQLTCYRQHSNQLTNNLVRKFLGGREARRVIIGHHKDFLIKAGIRPDRLWDAHRNEILLVYYRREFTAARKLLWSYWVEHPTDFGVLYRAFLSLLPARVIGWLRGKVSISTAVYKGGPDGKIWATLVAELSPALRSQALFPNSVRSKNARQLPNAF